MLYKLVKYCNIIQITYVYDVHDAFFLFIYILFYFIYDSPHYSQLNIECTAFKLQYNFNFFCTNCT